MMGLKTRLFINQSLILYQTNKKGTDYVLCWKSKGVHNDKLKLLYTAFLHSIKLSEYKMGIKFYKTPLASDQNNYAKL